MCSTLPHRCASFGSIRPSSCSSRALAPTAAADARSISPGQRHGDGEARRRVARSDGGRERHASAASGSRVSGGLWSFDRLADEGGGTHAHARPAAAAPRSPARSTSATSDRARGRLGRAGATSTAASAGASGSALPARRAGLAAYRSSPGRFDGLELIFSPAVAGNLNRGCRRRRSPTSETFGRSSGATSAKLLRFSGGRGAPVAVRRDARGLRSMRGPRSRRCPAAAAMADSAARSPSRSPGSAWTS